MTNRPLGEAHHKHARPLISLALLEAVSTPLLMRLLGPFQEALAPHGFVLGDAAAPISLAALHAVLERGDAPEDLVEALLQIEALAEDDAHEHLVMNAEALQLDLFTSGRRRLSAVDLAFSIYLEHRDTFHDASSDFATESVTRFVEFSGRKPQGPLALTSPTRRARLVESLQHWFASRNRTAYVEVEIFETPTQFNFHVVHGRPEKCRSVIAPDADRRTRLSYIPDKHDLLIYDPRTFKLCVNAQWAHENHFYRRTIGDIFFGDAEHFQPRSVFTGTPIQEEGCAALSTEGVDGLRSVALRELTVEHSKREKVLFKGDDLAKALLSESKRKVICEGTVAQMRFALGLAGRSRALKVEVALPNTLIYDRRIQPEVVRAFLRKRGFRAVSAEAG